MFNSEKLLKELGGNGWNLGLERMELMVKELHWPIAKLCSIHIAGTNGKGTVSRIVEKLLQQAGFKTGLFTSPHLVCPTERFCINGSAVDRTVFDELLQNHAAMLVRCRATYFEAMTIMAFSLFAQENVDIVILEVGLGGRFDATNVVSPACSVITNISLDHTEFLGETLEEIAGEKAGIIKQGVPCIVGDVEYSALGIIEEIAREKGAEVLLSQDLVSCSSLKKGAVRADIRFAFKGEPEEKVKFGLLGAHHVQNARTALAVASQFIEKRELVAAARLIFPGLSIPGRMDVRGQEPFELVDVAHNVASMQALVSGCRQAGIEKAHIVIGLLRDKDLGGILHVLAGFALSLFCVTPETERALGAEELADAAGACGVAAQSYDAVDKALAAARGCAGKGGAVIVTGSHFIAGEVVSGCNR